MSNIQNIKPMIKEDYSKIYLLWRSIPGIGLSDADSEEAISRYLDRNPDLSFVYLIDDNIVGTILCGHDRRRGYIHHTCVKPEYQGQNIGRALVEKALDGLRHQGISKCHLFVFYDNLNGQNFWSRLGWTKRSDILIYSKNIL